MKLAVGDRVVLRPYERCPMEEGVIEAIWPERWEGRDYVILKVMLDRQYWTKHPAENGIREVPKSQVMKRIDPQ